MAHSDRTVIGTDIYRKDIDGLRAVAILLVIGFHAYPDRIKSGFIGVDIFFVISGFLITSLITDELKRNDFSIIRFYTKRIRRLFPSLIAVLITSIIFGWFALFSSEYQQLGKHIFSGAIYLSNFTLWSESGYFDISSDNKPLLHLWSLAIEEQFYLVYPIILLFAYKTNLNKSLLITALALFSLWHSINLTETNTTAAFYSPLGRCWELMIGALIASLTNHDKRKGGQAPEASNAYPNAAMANILSIVGASLILAAAILLRKSDTFPGIAALTPTLGAGFLILAGPKALINHHLLSTRLAIWIGLISYPLYLWHWPLLSFSHIIESGVPSFNIRTGLVILSFGLAWLTYHLIERPLRFGALRTRCAPWLLASLCITGAVGFTIYKYEGFPSRSINKQYKDNNNELSRTPEQDSACLEYINNSKPIFEYCRHSGTTFQKTIALIGDSHAHAAFPGFSRILKQQQINTVAFANSSCPPFIGGEHGINNHEKEHCSNKTRQILETIKNQNDITRIYIFSRGPVYITGHEFNDPEPKPKLIIEAQRFKSSLQNTIDSLAKSGKQVYYVIENPEMHIHPARCFQRPFRLSHESCHIPKAAVLERQREYRNIISDLSNAKTIDSTMAFCQESHCSFVSSDGTLLHADRDHLSTAGSLVQAQYILSQERYEQ
jgi:peptidoglycan/LPS O-acetylase OafA/YrhL